MFPVRVSVESVRASNCLSCSHDGHLLYDTYAVVSGQTLLSQLVETVLSTLGQPQLAVNSRGLVQINNWKALPFEQITDNLEDTVETLFKDICSHLTLRILTKPGCTDSPSSQCISDLKQRLLSAAITKNPSILKTVNNQQIRDVITQVIAGEEPTILTAEQISAINDWLDSIENTKEERRSPTGSNIRFNQLFEIPKLEKWFRSDPSPNRQKLLQYMNILNTSGYRNNHPKITYQQLCNWFSTQRSSGRPSKSSSTSQCASSATNGLSSASTASASAALPPSTTPAPSTAPTPVTPTSLPANLLPKNALDSLPALFAADISGVKGGLDIFAFLRKTMESSAVAAEQLRMEGGSDSPTPLDDHFIHSSSENGVADGDYAVSLKQESTASSPDLSVNGQSATATSLASFSASNDLATAAAMNNATVARSRLMFDPLTELPVLERWFEENPHPTWMQIDQYTNHLNSLAYRESYPPISTHNVKIWFKNRRAKCKRLQSGINEKIGMLIGVNGGGEVGSPLQSSDIKVPSILFASS